MNKKILVPLLAFFALVKVMIGLVWLGFRIRPEPLPKTTKNRTVGTVDIPTTLPDPVRRYLRATARGDTLPLVKSAVLWGDGKLKRGPLWMPVRYRVAHLPGYHFRRMMEITWFGIPVIKGMDEYVNGQGKTTIAGQMATSPQINQAANLMLWVEAVAMPSLFITDPRIRWEAINNTTARLNVPFEDREDAVTFYFDEQTDLINRISALRYKNNSDKLLWTVEFLEWHPMNGGMYPAHIAVRWADEETPWSHWHFEAMDYNADLTPFIPEVAAEVPVTPAKVAVPA
jgi:hypothetical protein